MRPDAGYCALGVGRSHTHPGMIGTGAHVVRYSTGEGLLALCCGQRCNREKTHDERLNSCSFHRISNAVQTYVRPLWSQAACRYSEYPLFYSPGVIRCAVDVPAFMIHTPPDWLFSGNPSDCLVAPGTAIVMWFRACSGSAPI